MTSANPSRRLSPDQIAEINARTDLRALAESFGAVFRGRARYGSCPLCGGGKASTRFEIKDAGRWVCAACQDGGDAIALVMRFRNCGFADAIAELGGAPATVDPEVAARLAAERAERQREREQRATAARDAEKARARKIWLSAAPAAGSPVDDYFAHRGLAPLASRALRFLTEAPYFLPGDGPDAPAAVAHRGPCMVAAIQDADGRLCGVHRTWLDPRLANGRLPRDASGKAEIRAPDGELLPAKKMRGVKLGGAIRLSDAPAGEGRVVLLLGEGIETTASALQACRTHGASGLRFAAWAAGDLGNLSGGGLGPSQPHPERPGRWIPPEEPDPDAPGLLPPAWVDVTIILGDGDSDPHVTAARLECARRRYIAAGRAAAVAMAPNGFDFNDLARRIAA